MFVSGTRNFASSCNWYQNLVLVSGKCVMGIIVVVVVVVVGGYGTDSESVLAGAGLVAVSPTLT